jgi:hypothetical protein
MGVHFKSAPKKKRGGGSGGLFHGLLHNPVSDVVAQTGRDFGKIAESAPGGIVAQGRATYQDVVHPRPGTTGMNAILHPLRGIERTRQYQQIYKPGAIALAHSFEHPLAHPGYTLVSALGLVNPALRVGKVGVLARGSRVGQLDNALETINYAKKLNMNPKALSRGAIPDKMLALAQKDPSLARMHERRSHGNLSPDSAEYKRVAKAVNKAEKRLLAHGPHDRQIHYTASEAERQAFEKAGLADPIPDNYFTLVREAIKRGINPTKTHSSGLTVNKTREELTNEYKAAIGPPQITVSAPRSRVPTTALGQDALDALTRRSTRLAKRRVGKLAAREIDLAKREGQQLSPGFVQSLKTIYPNKRSIFDPKYNMNLALASIKHPDKEFNSMVRGERLYRPGYVPANWVGAIATNLIQDPLHFGSNLKYERWIRKHAPETIAKIDKRQGETTAQAAADVGKFSPGKDLPVSTLMHGVGTSLGKFVDRRARARAFISEFRRRNPDARPQDIVDALDDPARIHEMNMINNTAEEEAIRFSKTPALPGFHESFVSKVDRGLARNIFLYRWMTASTRYSGRMLKEHPTTSLGIALSGNAAPDLHKTLKEFPSFMTGYVPWGIEKVSGKKLPTVLNPQAASLWSMTPEIARDLSVSSHGGERAVDVLHERLNPFQHGLAVIARGRDPFRQQTITQGRKGHKVPAPFSKKAVRAALRAELSGTPYTSLGRLTESEQTRSKRLFPRSPEEIALQFMLGGFAVPSPVNPEIAKRMATKEKKPAGGGHSHKRKNPLGY